MVIIEGLVIRNLEKSEISILEDFLYEAIFQKDETSLLPRDIIKEPSLEIYIKDFGREDDYCLVAEVNNKIIGAVWTRVIEGFGSIDSNTPEVAISLYKEYRNKGIGTVLMRSMLELLKKEGYTKTSLAVQKENYAVMMYQKVGFEIIDKNDEEYIMICNLGE